MLLWFAWEDSAHGLVRPLAMGVKDNCCAEHEIEPKENERTISAGISEHEWIRLCLLSLPDGLSLRTRTMPLVTISNIFCTRPIAWLLQFADSVRKSKLQSATTGSNCSTKALTIYLVVCVISGSANRIEDQALCRTLTISHHRLGSSQNGPFNKIRLNIPDSICWGNGLFKDVGCWELL